MRKVCIGIPVYGQQPHEWWKPFAQQLYELGKTEDIEIIDILDQGSMHTDHNRNGIARRFLEYQDAEWLFWVDADNKNPVTALQRLLGHEKPMVSGVYYARSEAEPIPIAYIRLEDGRYKVISGWRRGEVIPADAAGMNCLLTHRSVYEMIDQKYVSLMRLTGGIIPVHVDDLRGDIFPDTEDETDGLVVNGQLRERLIEPPDGNQVPFFRTEFGRTEDYGFFEMAKRVGFDFWIDTTIECGHIMNTEIEGKEYREFVKEKNQS